MKVAIIGTRGIPANYGGFETLAENLTAHAQSCIEYTVYCSSKAYETKTAFYNNARLKYVGLDANGIQSIPYDIWSLVIVPLVGGPAELVSEGEEGCLISSCETQHIATKIISLYQDARLCIQLSEKTRAGAKQFSEDAFSKSLIHHIND